MTLILYARFLISFCSPHRLPLYSKRKSHLPAFPISKKNHTLPVKFTTNGTAYAGLRSKSTTVHNAFSILHLTHPAFVLVSMRSREG